MTDFESRLSELMKRVESLEDQLENYFDELEYSVYCVRKKVDERHDELLEEVTTRFDEVIDRLDNDQLLEEVTARFDEVQEQLLVLRLK